jgi:type I restriction-modification system DNA methylase subunit
MSLFQESIVRKHLSYLDQDVIEKAYIRFKEVYSANKIANIKIAKEEQYQEGFIKDIFGTVLGYSVFPEQPFNIQTEKKNVADSKKADGAIFQGEDVVGVIELKDNKTKNLDAVKDQAFGYKNNHKECSYVISSNFHKLRFYIDDATEYEEFDLYNLDKETFKRFYLYLRKEGLLDRNIPKLLRQETRFHEENITKSLYKDYSSFKNTFFQNVVKNNPQHDKLILFKKSQKFLDKVLFVLFAEDKGLVTTNSIVQIIEKWQDLKNDAFDTAKPLYHLVSLFFNNLFIGKKDQDGIVLIPEFGGEIFAPDEVLDTLIVDDVVLKDDLLKLSKYDFNTDVDVNILGHIFEHSLSEIEEVEAELKGEVADKTKGKRKKDGVFYTPKYITKYIVENTIGKLCTEKKAALNLDIDIAIFELQKADGKLNQKGIELYTSLNEYKNWLLTLKILDPACGSGAFLNQAVNTLAQEHKFADDIIAELTNTPLRLFDTDLAILENNIYGVDINEESIEIAKLSLWLRTAKQGRQLSNLSNNIKCGNSLIDDPSVAGDKAFNWHNEFPEVFAKGGFDVVIGNPPYVLSRDNKLEDYKKYISNRFRLTQEKANLYLIFIEKTYEILNNNGELGFVVPNSWLGIESAEKLRKFLLESTTLNRIISLNGESFPGVSVETTIFTYTKKIDPNHITKYLTTSQQIIIESEYKEIKQSNWLSNRSYIIDVLSKGIENEIVDKLFINSILLSEKFNVKVGMQAYEKGKGIPSQSADDVKNHIFDYSYKFDDQTYEYLNGGDIFRYGFDWSGQWLRYGKWLSQPKSLEQISSNRILVREITAPFPKVLSCVYIDEVFLNNKSILNILSSDLNFSLRYLLSILNSSLIGFYHLRRSVKGNRELFPKVVINDIKNFPIKDITRSEQQPFIDKANMMLSLNKELKEQSQRFQRTLERKFTVSLVSKKLADWYLLSYADFIKELGKKKIKLSLSEEADWETYFTTEAKKALVLKEEIEKTDNEINEMVYKLYDLNEEEIKIVVQG